MQKLKVLDIDLDFFLSEKHTGVVTETKRLEGNYVPWEIQKVRSFLEQNCGLNLNKKISGKIFKHHDEVFYYMRDLQIENDFKIRFLIDHVDAHADLGTGDASYKYISENILQRPLNERCFPEKINGWEGLSAGNFLAFAIACRWLEKLNYINVADWADDLQWFLFQDFNPQTDNIQLKHFSAEQMEKIIYGNGIHEEAKAATPMMLEPKVPFKVIDFNSFISDGRYDLIFLTQSPGFTPASSDQLIPVISEYIRIF